MVFKKCVMGWLSIFMYVDEAWTSFKDFVAGICALWWTVFHIATWILVQVHI